MTRLAALLGAAAAALAVGGPAPAAQPPTAHAMVDVNGRVSIRADSRSRTTVAYDPVTGEFDITDPGLTILPDAPCISLSAHHVTCTAELLLGYTFIGSPQADVVNFAGVPAASCLTACQYGRIAGGNGNDTIYASQGGTSITGGGGRDFLVGGAGADSLNGGRGNDVLWGHAGNDRLNAARGDDGVFGGVGNDRLQGEGGSDLLAGGPGSDLLLGGKGQDSFTGGGGNDTLSARDGTAEVVRGGGGFDRGRIDVGLDRRRGIERML